MTFTKNGEELLSQWMVENAFVTWEVRAKPWLYEKELIDKFSFPLNLQGNNDHPFWQKLSQIRADAIKNAKNTPIIKN